MIVRYQHFSSQKNVGSGLKRLNVNHFCLDKHIIYLLLLGETQPGGELKKNPTKPGDRRTLTALYIWECKSLHRFDIKAPRTSKLARYHHHYAKPGLCRDRNKAFVIICWFVLLGFVSVFYFVMFLAPDNKTRGKSKILIHPSQIKLNTGLGMVTW